MHTRVSIKVYTWQRSYYPRQSIAQHAMRILTGRSDTVQQGGRGLMLVRKRGGQSVRSLCQQRLLAFFQFAVGNQVGNRREDKSVLLCKLAARGRTHHAAIPAAET